MYNHPETSVHSAKAFAELNDKRAKDAKRQKDATNLATKLATDQVALLKEANDLARQAQVEAQESKAESYRSSRMAFWSNVIATASLIVAIASLVFAYVSSGS